MTSPTRALVVVRAPELEQPNNDRHVTLAVRPEIACVCDYMDLDNPVPLVEWFDPHDPAAWFDLGLDALDVVGTLARLALDVHRDIIATGYAHGCDSLPRPARRDDDAEIPAATRTNLDACSVWLSRRPGDPLTLEGELPYLFVTVPRNRERAWTARLTDRLATIDVGNAETLAPINEPATVEEA